MAKPSNVVDLTQLHRQRAELTMRAHQRDISMDKLTRAAMDVANANTAWQLAERAHRRAVRRTRKPQEPLSWVGSLFFIVPMLLAALALLWARAMGWLV